MRDYPLSYFIPENHLVRVVNTVVESIDKKLAENPTDKELKKKAKEFKKDILPRKQKYEEAFATFKGRNSYSKTDHFICRNDKRLIHVGDRKYVTECKNTDKNRTVPL